MNKSVSLILILCQVILLQNNNHKILKEITRILPKRWRFTLPKSPVPNSVALKGTVDNSPHHFLLHFTNLLSLSIFSAEVFLSPLLRKHLYPLLGFFPSSPQLLLHEIFCNYLHANHICEQCVICLLGLSGCSIRKIKSQLIVP